MKERIEYLVKYLNERTVEYDNGKPTISDRDWDTFYFELKDLELMSGIVLPDSPTQIVYFNLVNELNKSTHNHKMLSLPKTKDLSEIENFLMKKAYIAMCKMDGLTLSIRYLDGKLVSAETRGDGLVGEDVYHNALVIPSIPKKIPYYDELILDGEIICSYKDFEEFAGEYKNPRNFAAGSIRLLDSKECEKRNLTFVVWEVIKGLDTFPTLSSKFAALQEFYFTTVPFSKEDIATSVETLKEAAVNLSYPIDGVVFKFDEVEYGRSLGETSHHFKNAIAFKFYDETYPTKMLDIEFTMGRTGVLTPVAVFEPIEIDGSVVERASLHNISVMYETMNGGSFVGQKVEVFKANMIIPQIVSGSAEHMVPTGAKMIPIPEYCPVCGGTTKIVDNDGVRLLVCENPACEGKLINRLDHFCGKKGLDIKGLSVATLEKLINWGWVSNCEDIFNLALYADEWEKKPGFGARSVEKILTAIEESKKCEFWQFISAIGIPLIGSTYAKQMAKREFGWVQIREDIEGKYDFTKWDGFGAEMCKSLWGFDYQEADNIFFNYLAPTIKNSLWENPNVEKIPQKNSLDGITVVITGKLTKYKNRAALQEEIEKAGGKVVGSVSKNTNYLINNDSTSTSSKNLTAQKLGVEILTEEEFQEKFLK